MSLPVPKNKANDTNREKIKEYLNQLSKHEQTAYLIAHNHLGTSFNILKSNGYKEWIKNA